MKEKRVASPLEHGSLLSFHAIQINLLKSLPLRYLPWLNEVESGVLTRKIRRALKIFLKHLHLILILRLSLPGQNLKHRPSLIALLNLLL